MLEIPTDRPGVDRVTVLQDFAYGVSFLPAEIERAWCRPRRAAGVSAPVRLTEKQHR
jgi:hypothetical protein